MTERTMEEWEQLLNWAEDRREIKNTMGKYAQCVLLLLDDEREKLWSTRDDICLGLNDGWYVGKEAIAAYYAQKKENDLKKAAVMQQIFPKKLDASKKPEEFYGVGLLEEKPVGTPVIEIAKDRKTAKGVWYSQGNHTDITTRGPLSQWTWGFYAADFVLEDGAWKLWHLQYLEDMKAPVGTNWAKPDLSQFPELPEFAALADLKDAAPTVPVTLRARYAPDRPFTKLIDLPEPYETFAQTFSYGYQEV